MMNTEINITDTPCFLGERAAAKTTDSQTDLGDVVREMDERLVINDEAHHILVHESDFRKNPPRRFADIAIQLISSTSENTPTP